MRGRVHGGWWPGGGRSRLAPALLFAALSFAGACGGGETSETGPASDGAAGGREAGRAGASSGSGDGSPPAGAGGDVRFVEATEESGVDFVHNTGAFGERWMPETIGPGVVVFDADGDERDDLLFVNGRNFPGRPGETTTSRLFLNQGGFRFADRTAEAGLDVSAYCLGGAAGDLDNDGDADLYLTCVGQDLLFRNDDGRFTEVGAEAGISREYEFGAGAVLFDADGDGLLDIYATRYVTWTPEDDLYCSLDGESKSYCTPRPYDGASPRFYRNLGGFAFEERTREAGLYQPEAKALGVTLLDLEWDGWTDLLVAGDTYPNLLYRNRGDGTFEEIGGQAGIAFSETGRARGGMGVDAADYDRSGRPGAVITYFSLEMVGLYQNLGDSLFHDVASRSAVGRNTFHTLGWGTFFFDYDLDGWLDLMVANGHLDEQVENVQEEVTYAQPQQLFRNAGGGELREVTDTVSPELARPLVARGAAYGDLDGDGDLDLVLTTNGGPAHLYRNEGDGHGHWLRLDLTGSESNRDAVGARVEVTVAGETQTWLVRTGGSYLSQSQVEPTFGLGPAATVDEVVVHWPSGEVTTVSDVPADQVLEVVESPSE
ncbi:MAG: CRTAC1 family protein [Thermoanaerobaculia bacterium]